MSSIRGVISMDVLHEDNTDCLISNLILVTDGAVYGFLLIDSLQNGFFYAGSKPT